MYQPPRLFWLKKHQSEAKFPGAVRLLSLTIEPGGLPHSSKRHTETEQLSPASVQLLSRPGDVARVITQRLRPCSFPAISLFSIHFPRDSLPPSLSLSQSVFPSLISPYRLTRPLRVPYE